MKLALFLVALVGFGRSADACTTLPMPPTRVPDTNVALEGLVVGYSESDGPILGAERVPGLAVRVVTPMLSSHADSTVEVYLFGSSPDCSPSARSLADLHDQYPVGTAVTVIGQVVGRRNSPSPATTVLSLADDWGHVAAVPNDPPRTSEGVLDFRAFSLQHETQPVQGFSLSLAWRNAHRGWYEDFEYLRCLVLLLRLRDNASKVALLQNIKSYSRFGHLESGWARDAYGEVVASAHLLAPLVKTVLVPEVQP